MFAGARPADAPMFIAAQFAATLLAAGGAGWLSAAPVKGYRPAE